LKALVDKLMNTRFEPSGYTGNPSIPYAHSVLDYIARWLGGRFISANYFQPGLNEAVPAAAPAAHASPAASAGPLPLVVDAAMICQVCGMLMLPNGSCYKCANCGATSGCS